MSEKSVLKSGKLKCPVAREQVAKAVKALLDWYVKQHQDSNVLPLMDSDESGIPSSELFLTFALKRVPHSSPVKPYRIPLAHTIYGCDGQEVCLIIKDKKDGDDESQDLESKIKDAHVPNIARILTISKLREDFRQYKFQRELLSSYNLFLADDRVLRLLPALLGKKFFLKKKHPGAVNLRSANWALDVARARDSTFLYISSGSSISVRIAKTGFTQEEIADNIMTALPHIVYRLPRRWKNVQSIFLKTADSVSLPIYSALPDPVSCVATDKASPDNGASSNNDSDEMHAQRKSSNGKKSKTRVAAAKSARKRKSTKSK